MNCTICGEWVPAEQRVTINGQLVGVGCFPEALKKLTFKPEDLAIALNDAMDPMTAYKLGKSHVAIIVASRRRTKKRK